MIAQCSDRLCLSGSLARLPLCMLVARWSVDSSSTSFQSSLSAAGHRGPLLFVTPSPAHDTAPSAIKGCIAGRGGIVLVVCEVHNISLL